MENVIQHVTSILKHLITEKYYSSSTATHISVTQTTRLQCSSKKSSHVWIFLLKSQNTVGLELVFDIFTPIEMCWEILSDILLDINIEKDATFK